MAAPIVWQSISMPAHAKVAPRLNTQLVFPARPAVRLNSMSVWSIKASEMHTHTQCWYSPLVLQ